MLCKKIIENTSGSVCQIPHKYLNVKEQFTDSRKLYHRTLKTLLLVTEIQQTHR